MLNKTLLVAVLTAVLAGPPIAAGEAPPLSAGLSDEDAVKSDQPALPPGLGAGDQTDAPALPEGLAPDAEEDAAPALPAGLGEPDTAADAARTETTRLQDRLPVPLYGFWEVRAGVRIDYDPAQPDLSIAESRLQLETEKTLGDLFFESTADIYLDGVTEEPDADLRKLSVTLRPAESVDIRVGRQVLTWGTGDMLFINDLFPKDWQSFFTGRDVEYLKAPSNSIRVGLFSSTANIDLVYTPKFTPDRYITGERISYWDPMSRAHAGKNDRLQTDRPDAWFDEDEWAVRIHRTFGATELALYAYDGYWKSPGGQRLFPIEAVFPRLGVYGASVRGTIGKAVVNAEAGYYDSRDDNNGSDPFINNGELRLLVGYERELA